MVIADIGCIQFGGVSSDWVAADRIGVQIGQPQTRVVIAIGWRYKNKISSMAAEESQFLKGHSLESFIILQTEQPQISPYNLDGHPKLHTVSPQYISLLKVFSGSSFTEYRQLKAHLPPFSHKQEAQLRRLTILDCLRKRASVSLKHLSRAVQLAQRDTYTLLMQMSGLGMINIEINELTGEVVILWAAIRRGEASEDEVALGVAQLQRILEKNAQISAILEASEKRVLSTQILQEYKTRAGFKGFQSNF